MFKWIKYLFRFFQYPKKENNKKEMNNVVNSMFLCQPIYDKLKVKCHPDRFLEDEQKVQATILFQKLQKCRYNYEQLLIVQKEIEEFLSK